MRTSSFSHPPIEVGAIDKANQLVRVIGKGNTERLVPLHYSVIGKRSSCYFRRSITIDGYLKFQKPRGK
jgi:site-specific recombinase XerC